jgi:histidine triad (HIT) family protein
MENCLFCKIAANEIPSDKLYEDEIVLAFHDISPQSPVHILVIPKAHVARSLADISPANSAVVAHCLEVIAKLANDLGLQDGCRLVSNCGEGAGQSVHHLHFHLLAGRDLDLSMG